MLIEVCEGFNILARFDRKHILMLAYGRIQQESNNTILTTTICNQNFTSAGSLLLGAKIYINVNSINNGRPGTHFLPGPGSGRN